MNGRNSYLVVGVFVSLGLGALIFMILSFAGGRSSEPNARYTVFFERDVSGLTMGAPVRYLGVGVGQVVAMRLAAHDSTKVRVDLEILQSTPISSATYAALSFQGVTGVAFISLAADQGAQTTDLAAGDFEYPIIPSRAVGLAAILTEAPEIAHQVAVLLDRATRLLDEENTTSLSRTVANIEAITESLAGGGDAMASLPEQLGAVLLKIETTFGQVQATLDQVEPELSVTMSRLSEASTHLANVSSRLDGWLADGDGEMSGFIRGGLGQTPALIAEMRSTMRELEKLLAEMRKDPSQLVYKPQSDPVVVEP